MMDRVIDRVARMFMTQEIRDGRVRVIGIDAVDAERAWEGCYALAGAYVRTRDEHDELGQQPISVVFDLSKAPESDERDTVQMPVAQEVTLVSAMRPVALVRDAKPIMRTEGPGRYALHGDRS